jgi:aspartyl-tRNA synthetase
MAIMGDLGRVFEIGPVFRAEKSFTNRHMTEFVGMDLEMAIKEHYFEVLDVIGNMFFYIFKNLESRFKVILDTINEQYPFEPFVVGDKPLWVTYEEGV